MKSMASSIYSTLLRTLIPLLKDGMYTGVEQRKNISTDTQLTSISGGYVADLMIANSAKNKKEDQPPRVNVSLVWNEQDYTRLFKKSAVECA